MEQALTALVAAHRSAEVDRRIDIAYREMPLTERDEWGDLDSFLDAAGRGDSHESMPDASGSR